MFLLLEKHTVFRIVKLVSVYCCVRLMLALAKGFGTSSLAIDNEQFLKIIQTTTAIVYKHTTIRI